MFFEIWKCWNAYSKKQIFLQLWKLTKVNILDIQSEEYRLFAWFTQLKHFVQLENNLIYLKQFVAPVNHKFNNFIKTLGTENNPF